MFMRCNGHNSRLNRAGAFTLAVALTVTPVAHAQTGSDTSSRPAKPAAVSSSSAFIPRLPSIKVPEGVREAADVFGIKVPKRIDLDPRATMSPKKQAAQVPADAPLSDKVAAHARDQLLLQGHVENPEAQRIANDWARQAVAGEATFTGDVGRGTTGLDRGTGNIYRLTPTKALERINYLTSDERFEDVGTAKDPNPKRFGVATALAQDGQTIYLVEYFLN